ncbi:MAG: T9SS type A sorting domain-containing protein [Candidatus Poribacteria bacterium]|nr:T9SS type A sorting domain-containing protein [Candidatus Poribacteria bacterium]
MDIGKITPRGGDNINDLLNNIGMAEGDIDDHSSYALITLESATAQSGVLMKVGSSDAIKVWLNGEVVHNHPIDRSASDFKDDFTVDLEKGDNLLLVKVSERDRDWSMFVGIEADVNAVYKRPPNAVVAADVNGDGIVNIQDLVLVSSSLGQTGQSRADVNGDGVVNIQDLVMVAGVLGQGTAASPTLHASDLEGLTAAEVQDMLTQARQMGLTDPAYLRGIAVLEQLLARLLPKETALLPNYPNPFNPETWIPYQLAKPAEGTLHIYAVDGRLVRVLALGHQSAGKYQSRSRAAYWDGRNSLGEPVASGTYFYTLTAGDFTATRKMLIQK